MKSKCIPFLLIAIITFSPLSKGSNNGSHDLFDSTEASLTQYEIPE